MWRRPLLSTKQNIEQTDFSSAVPLIEPVSSPCLLTLGGSRSVHVNYGSLISFNSCVQGGMTVIHGFFLFRMQCYLNHECHCFYHPLYNHSTSCRVYSFVALPSHLLFAFRNYPGFRQLIVASRLQPSTQSAYH